MKISVVTGSRADFGMLEWPVKLMREDQFFEVEVVKVWNFSFTEANQEIISGTRPDLLMILGDRYEILAVATAAHLLRIPIAHIAGGDVTEGSYDDAMRDCISRMASIHFVTSTSAMARLTNMGFKNIHLVGSPGIDYIRHSDWRSQGVPVIEKPYVVVAYYPETIDGTVDLEAVHEAIGGRKAIWIKPNPDMGCEKIPATLEFPHGQFLNVIANCEEFIGNSSSMLYEAPELGVKVRMIGKRQRGRVIPWGDGFASERIIKALKYSHL